jgi:lipopolysaccharide biosynthesis glycosyltransferase/16S rRNA G966 N2-methylase RsmD
MYAYVTLVMKGDFYIPGALALAHSLRQSGTKNAIVCMVTDDVVNVLALEAVFDRVVQVDYIRGEHHPFPNEATLHKYATWENIVLTQHQCLSLSEYSKVCFLDSDVVVLRNMDSVFELETPAGTFYETIPVGRCKHTDRIHGETIPASYILDCLAQNKYLCIANCLLLTPGDMVYKQFMLFLKQFYMEHENKFGFKGWNAHANEQMITYFYCHELAMDWKFVGLSYQCVPWKYVDHEVPPFLHHYMSRVKPWEVPENKFTHSWWSAAKKCIKSNPDLKALFHIEKRDDLRNVADCRQLTVPSSKYKFSGKLNSHKPLKGRLQHLNKCTAIKTLDSMEVGTDVVDAPQGFGLFQSSIEGRVLVNVHSELISLFKDPQRYNLLDSYEGKNGLIALFWPGRESCDRAISLQDGLMRLKAVGAQELVSALELTYVPLMMRVLDLPLESILEASVEIIFYKAISTAGLEQHVDNVTRTKGHLGPVCSIGFGSSRCLDLLPYGYDTAGTPLRQRTYPGEMLVLTSRARICWSHCVPYGCDYERFSVVIRPCVSSQTSRIGTEPILHVPIFKPTAALCSALVNRTGKSSVFAMYGVSTMLYTKEETHYITWPWDSHTRNQHIRDLLQKIESPVVWDLYAGIGGDSVQLTHASTNGVVHAVQINTPPGRVRRLRHNVKHFAERCVVHECSASYFVLGQNTGCDLLYIDPPWMDKSFKYLSAAELSGQLEAEIFNALETPVGIVCLKTRYAWKDLDLKHTALDKTIASDGRKPYMFHFFRIVKGI